MSSTTTIYKKKYNPKSKKILRYTRGGQYRGGSAMVRNYRNGRRTMVNRTLTSFIAPQFFTKHVFGDEVNFSTSASNPLQVRTFKLNGMFNVDGAGGQPRGYDELTALYDEWVVYGCKWSISFNNRQPQTATDRSTVCFAQEAWSTTAPNDIRDIMEDWRMKRRIMGPAGSGKDTTTISKYCRLNNVFGMSKRKLFSDDLYAGGSTFNPTNEAQLYVGMYNQDFATPAEEQIFGSGFIRMVFYCRWQHKRKSEQS